VVDGDWLTDSQLPLSESNREGQVNNVIEVPDHSINLLQGHLTYLHFVPL